MFEAQHSENPHLEKATLARWRIRKHIFDEYSSDRGARPTKVHLPPNDGDTKGILLISTHLNLLINSSILVEPYMEAVYKGQYIKKHMNTYFK